ncbi:MAG: FadR/GntR family transcriptional regulator [Clostridium sp.]
MVEEKSRVEKAADRILEIIESEKLVEGDRLPSEYELAKFVEVGRSTIREAIRALVSQNILHIKRGVGTFITGKKIVADDPLGLSAIANKIKLAKDLLEVRFMIEPKIAGLAAENATEDDIKEIGKLCDLVDKYILEEKEHMEVDIKFHEAIAKSSKNTVVAQLIPIINNSIYVFTDITNYKLKKETMETHREIFNAIKNRNSSGASDAMYLHLVYNRKNIENLINKKKKTSD